MRAPERAHAPVEVVRHGELFTRRLGVEIDEGEARLARCREQRVRRAERVVALDAHIDAPDQVQHADLDAPAGEHAPAAPGRARAEVRGAQEVGAVVEVGCDLRASEGVVAERDDVRAGGEHRLGVLARQSDHLGVFAVDDGEVNAVERLRGAQVLCEVPHAALTDHVADGENAIEHGLTCFHDVFSSIANPSENNKRKREKPRLLFRPTGCILSNRR